MESVLLSLTPGQVAEISQQSPTVGAIWQRFKSNIDPPISVILILNTTAHTIGATVAGASFAELTGSRWLWAFSILFTFVMLQYTEILPKTMGVRFNRPLAIWMARPLALMVQILSPIIDFVRLLNRIFEPKTDRHAERPTTIAELAYIASLARNMHEIDTGQEQIIIGATRLSKMTVGQVMIPIADVSVIPSSLSISEALVEAHLDAHTRFPVCRNGDRNCILGYVNFKELVASLRMNPHFQDLMSIIRPIHTCSPGEKVPTLLQHFTQKHEHVAIVVAEDGNVLGLVTLEDIVEELVGELEDEFDRLPNRIQRSEGDHLWLVGGGTPIVELLHQMDEPSPDPPPVPPQLSIAAWLEPMFELEYTLHHAEEVQRTGMPFVPFVLRPMDEIEVGDLRFQVRRLRRHRIFEVAVFRQSRLEETPLSGNDPLEEDDEAESREILNRIYTAPGELFNDDDEPENMPTSIDESYC